MEKEFVPYEQALALKGLGLKVDFAFGHYNYSTRKMLDYINERVTKSFFPAPTFSQTFRWFREKYDLVSWVRRRPGFVKEYSWYVSDFNDEDPDEYYFDLHIETYEEAELECLKKLIEIVKEK